MSPFRQGCEATSLALYHITDEPLPRNFLNVDAVIDLRMPEAGKVITAHFSMRVWRVSRGARAR